MRGRMSRCSFRTPRGLPRIRLAEAPLLPGELPSRPRLLAPPQPAPAILFQNGPEVLDSFE